MNTGIQTVCNTEVKIHSPKCFLFAHHDSDHSFHQVFFKSEEVVSEQSQKIWAYIVKQNSF